MKCSKNFPKVLPEEFTKACDLIKFVVVKSKLKSIKFRNIWKNIYLSVNSVVNLQKKWTLLGKINVSQPHLYTKPLKEIGICWNDCAFLNVFEDDICDIKSFDGTVIAMRRTEERLKKCLKSIKSSMNLSITQQPEVLFVKQKIIINIFENKLVIL